MIITPDLSEIKEEVAPGTYKGVVKNATEGAWSTGTKFINWEIETYGESDPKNNGRRIFHKTPINGKGAFRLAEFFKAATGQALTGAFDTNQILGKKVEVTVAEGKAQDGTPSGYMEVGKVRRVDTQALHA